MARDVQINIGEEVSKLISKINEKNPYLIVGIGAGIILIGFYFIFFQAKFKEITILSAEMGNLRQTLEQTQSNLQRVNQYNKERANLNQKIENFSKKIKSKDEIPGALEKLSRLAAQNGVKIEQMMPDEAHSEVVLKNEEGHFISIPVVIGARSSYHDYGRFVDKLEDAGIFLGISDFGIMTNSADSNKHLVKMVLRLIIFEKVDKNEQIDSKTGKPIKK